MVDIAMLQEMDSSESTLSQQPHSRGSRMIARLAGRWRLRELCLTRAYTRAYMFRKVADVPTAIEHAVLDTKSDSVL